MAQSFGKAEKLKSRKWIEQIFAAGKAEKAFPVLAIFAPFEAKDEVAVKAGFSVSKRKMKRAVDRNLIKRRMREAYRLNKSKLKNVAEPGQTLGVMFIYMPSKALDFNSINQAFERLLEKLNKEQ